MKSSSAALATHRDACFDSAGLALRYVERSVGEPVVLVHSYASSVEDQWARSGVLEALAQSHRVIALDLRGHGRSAKPHDPQAYGPEMAWDIVRLLDHLGLRKAHVVGYSMGAHIVAQLLVLAPERLVTATLGGASGRRDWTADNDRQAEIEAAEMERGSLRSQLSRLAAAGAPRPSRAQAAAASAKYLAGKDHLALAAVRRSNRRQAIATADLARVHVPVLGIVGSDDPYAAGFRELQRVMPVLELVVIEGATHEGAASRPEFLAALRRFLHAHAMKHAR